MAIPGTQPRRTIDVITQTIVSVAMVAGATWLGVEKVFDVGSILAAYGIAAATSGLPIVVKREDHRD